jgi:hypothetical protein
MALMNARYYLQTDAASVGPPELRVRHEVYRPQLRINTSQDDKLREDVSDDAVLHTTRPIQAVMVGNCMIFNARVLMIHLSTGIDEGNAFFLVGVTDY